MRPKEEEKGKKFVKRLTKILHRDLKPGNVFLDD